MPQGGDVPSGELNLRADKGWSCAKNTIDSTCETLQKSGSFQSTCACVCACALHPTLDVLRDLGEQIQAPRQAHRLPIPLNAHRGPDIEPLPCQGGLNLRQRLVRPPRSLDRRRCHDALKIFFSI